MALFRERLPGQCRVLEFLFGGIGIRDVIQVNHLKGTACRTAGVQLPKVADNIFGDSLLICVPCGEGRSFRLVGVDGIGGKGLMYLGLISERSVVQGRCGAGDICGLFGVAEALLCLGEHFTSPLMGLFRQTPCRGGLVA